MKRGKIIRGGGIECDCGSLRTRVSRTLKRSGVIRRERECRDCGGLVITTESRKVAIDIRPVIASSVPMTQNPTIGVTNVRPDPHRER